MAGDTELAAVTADMLSLSTALRRVVRVCAVTTLVALFAQGYLAQAILLSTKVLMVCQVLLFAYAEWLTARTLLDARIFERVAVFSWDALDELTGKPPRALPVRIKGAMALVRRLGLVASASLLVAAVQVLSI